MSTAALHKYWAVFCLSLIRGAKNYKMLIGLGIYLVTCLIIFAYLWEMAALHPDSTRYDPALLLWYIALNEWVLIAVPDVHREMEHELQSGSLAYSMVRPISYLGAKFAEGFGHLCVNLTFLGIITFGFTFFWTHELHFSIVDIVFGLLAGMLGLVFQMLVGLSSFWFQDVSPISWIYEKLLFVFGGLMVPLSFYPDWMQTIARFSPASCILGARSALVFDCSLEQVGALFTSIFIWFFISVSLLCFAFLRGMKILNVQGG
jgi:ABC-2 type transport system permease protein